jgi:hypothetical protein
MRILIAAGLAILNFVVYGLGFLIGVRLLYWGHERPALMCGGFLAISILTGLWSKWWAVVGPAWLGFLWGVGAMKWAIHMTDIRGDYVIPMSDYILSPERSDIVWSLVAAAAAAVGWWISVRLRSYGVIGATRGPRAREGTQK